MIWGTPYSERKHRDVPMWWDWYAWHPTQMPDGRWVWLEWVGRRWKDGHHGLFLSDWDYRYLDSTHKNA